MPKDKEPSLQNWAIVKFFTTAFPNFTLSFSSDSWPTLSRGSRYDAAIVGSAALAIQKRQPEGCLFRYYPSVFL